MDRLRKGIKSHLVVYCPIEIQELKKETLKLQEQHEQNKQIICSVINALYNLNVCFTFRMILFPILAERNFFWLTYEESKNTEKKFHAFVTVF